MSVLEAKYFVRSITRFLHEQIAGGRFAEDVVESLEVAAQCLETAYDLPSSAGDDPDASAPAASGEQLDETHPLSQIDLFALFQSAAGAAGAGLVSAERKAEADVVKNEGNGLMKESKFNEALQAYSRAITLDATNPVFYCNRAAAYSRLGDYEKAAADCRMSLRYDPNYSKAYGRLGIAYSKLDRHDLALAAYQDAVRLDPDNLDYQNNLAVTQQRLDEAANAPPAAAAAPAGGLPAGFPDLSNLNLGAALANPELMSMAQRMMSDPAVRNIVSNIQFNGNMDNLFEIGQEMASRMRDENPELIQTLQNNLGTHLDPTRRDPDGQNSPDDAAAKQPPPPPGGN